MPIRAEIYPHLALTASACNTHHQSHMCDQSELKPETRTQSPSADPVPFRASHLKKNRMGVHLFIGRNELIRPKREMYSHRRNQTHGRSHGKSRRVSQKTDPRKNRARRRNRPTPGFSAMGNRHGKPQQKPYGKPTSGICFVHEWDVRETRHRGPEPQKKLRTNSLLAA